MKRIYHELFEELIKTLILISWPWEKQIEYNKDFFLFYDDVSNNFDFYYIRLKNDFLDRKLLNSKQCQILDHISLLFEDHLQKREYLDFWMDYKALKKDPDWKKLRLLSKKVLKMLSKDELDIKIEMQIKFSKGSDGGEIQTKRLIQKLYRKEANT